MKKIIAFMLLALMFSLLFRQGNKVNAANSNTNTNIQTNKKNVIVVIYNNFDEMKDAGEQIFYDKDNFSGYFSFQSAYRIGKTEKFKVTYVANK